MCGEVGASIACCGMACTCFSYFLIPVIENNFRHSAASPTLLAYISKAGTHRKVHCIRQNIMYILMFAFACCIGRSAWPSHTVHSAGSAHPASSCPCTLCCETSPSLRCKTSKLTCKVSVYNSHPTRLLGCFYD